MNGIRKIWMYQVKNYLAVSKVFEIEIYKIGYFVFL